LNTAQDLQIDEMVVMLIFSMVKQDDNSIHLDDYEKLVYSKIGYEGNLEGEIDEEEEY